MRKDYMSLGISIQDAMLDHADHYPDPQTRPETILWGDLEVSTGHKLAVPNEGHFSARFLTAPTAPAQGFDLSVNGWVRLGNGETVKSLRTWNEPGLTSEVEHAYRSADGLIWVWNVFKRQRAGQLVEEKWTGNAGLWIEEIADLQYSCHCSPGPLHEPNFESLTFHLTFRPSAA